MSTKIITTVKAPRFSNVAGGKRLRFESIESNGEGGKLYVCTLGGKVILHVDERDIEGVE